MRRARSGNLTALLVVISLLEFLINRLAGRLFFPRPALTSGGAGSCSGPGAATRTCAVSTPLLVVIRQRRAPASQSAPVTSWPKLMPSRTPHLRHRATR